MNKVLLIFLGIFGYGLIGVASATGIDKNTAKMQAMDKITGRVSVIEVPVGGMVKFGSLSIVVRACKTRPMEEAPDNFAFTDISDKTLKGEDVNIFRGWMISSSPATHAVEHPIYDVWLLSCTDQKVNKKLLLTEEQLAAHENLPRQNAASETTAETAAGSAQPIAEMQEDEAVKKHREPQQLEFSYDEADEAEEAEEAQEEDNADETGEIPDKDFTININMEEQPKAADLQSDSANTENNKVAPLPIMTQDDDANIRIFDDEILPKIDSLTAE